MAAPPQRRLTRRSVPDALREALQERILNGEFRDGDTLVQESIAEDYGVSRIPVREALRQLEAGGLIAIRAHRGAVVTTLPTEEIDELFTLRALLEGEVLAIAIARMTDRDVDEAAAILARLERSYRAGDTAEWGRLNWAFHRRLYEPSGRVRTLQILDGINLQLDRYVRLHLVVTAAVDDAEREHRDLLRLCAARDADAAVDDLRRHIDVTRRSLLRRLRDHRTASGDA